MSVSWSAANDDVLIEDNWTSGNDRVAMSLYGMAISTLGGFMFGLGFLGHATDSTLDEYLTQFLLAMIFGGGIGYVYGFVASPLLGIMIASLTLIFFREMRHPRLFRAAAGAITAGVIYIFSPLDIVRWSLATMLNNDISRYPESVGVLILFVLAIYLSQIVARKYIQDVSPNGRKAKAR